MWCVHFHNENASQCNHISMLSHGKTLYNIIILSIFTYFVTVVYKIIFFLETNSYTIFDPLTNAALPAFISSIHTIVGYNSYTPVTFIGFTQHILYKSPLIG